MKRIILIIGWFLSLIVIILIGISTLDHLDVYSSKDTLYGIDFLSALWVGAAAIVPIVLFFFAGRIKLAIPLLIVACIYTAVFGDFSLSFLVYRNKPKDGLVKKITVEALNVEYYAHGVNEVMTGVLSLAPNVYTF